MDPSGNFQFNGHIIDYLNALAFDKAQEEVVPDIETQASRNTYLSLLNMDPEKRLKLLLDMQDKLWQAIHGADNKGTCPPSSTPDDLRADDLVTDINDPGGKFNISQIISKLLPNADTACRMVRLCD
jgi:hypothetical protein